MKNEKYNINEIYDDLDDITMPKSKKQSKEDKKKKILKKFKLKTDDK